MNWISMKKQMVPKQKAISAVVESDYEREVNKFKTLEKSSQKLYNDMKKYNDSLHALSKCEEKLVNSMKTIPGLLSESGVAELQRSKLPMMIDNYSSVQYRAAAASDIMANTGQKVVVEPMKILCSVYPNVHCVMKRREQCVQDVNKWQAKVEKYQDKDKTGPNLAKLGQNKKALSLAKQQFESENLMLMQELPSLCEQRVRYYQPSLSTLTSTQIGFYNEMNMCYESVCQQPSDLSIFSDQRCKQQGLEDLRKDLDEMKALTIVKDD